jgi:hypothetical protein
LTDTNDLAVAEAEPPTGGEAHTDLLCEVLVYSISFTLLLIALLHNIFYEMIFKFFYPINKSPAMDNGGCVTISYTEEGLFEFT